MVRRVGIVLRLKAQTTGIAGEELDARLSGPHLHHPSGEGLDDPCRERHLFIRASGDHIADVVLLLAELSESRADAPFDCEP